MTKTLALTLINITIEMTFKMVFQCGCSSLDIPLACLFHPNKYKLEIMLKEGYMNVSKKSLDHTYTRQCLITISHSGSLFPHLANL